MNDEELPSWLKDYAAQTPAPESDPRPPRPTFLLHPIQGVFWAAFLGSFMAGGIVVALNFLRLEERRRAWIAFLTGLVASLTLTALLSLLPDDVRIPSWWIALPQGAIAASLASHYQQVRILDHTRRGGTVASGWRSAGIGILSSMVLIGPFLAVAWHQSQAIGERQRFGGDSIFLLAEASQPDAARLAKVLREIRFFRDEGSEVQLRREEAVESLAANWPDEATRKVLTDACQNDVSEAVRGLAACRLCGLHSKFGRRLFSRDLDGVGPYLDPYAAVKESHIEACARSLRLSPAQTTESIADLNRFVGWDVRKGLRPAPPKKTSRKPRKKKPE